jgi:type VI secretion system secreted protein VgrG
MPRIFTVHTPVGPEMLKFQSLSGRERISRLFEFRLGMLSTSQDITAEQLLGHDVTVEVETQALGRRFLNGEVTSFALVGRDGRYHRYEAIVRPWAWYMTRTANCRIFQQKTVIEIIEDLFFKYGDVPSWGLLNRTNETYRKWDYCVQYQETDFNFVSRMMEHEGICYYFKHEKGKHTLVLADSPGGHDALPEYDRIPYIGRDAVGEAREEHVESWRVSKQVDSGGYITDDYDFTKPRAKLEQRKTHPLGHANDRYKVYEYPGGYTIPSPDGEFYAKVRLEELQAPHEILVGQTRVRGVAPGYRFDLYRCPRADQNRTYLILGVDYQWTENPYEAEDDEGTLHEATITCQDSAVQYRPPRATPKPLTNGPQTAEVVGPPGEEIYTDGYGRVKVQFRWDREGKRDQNSSCWIRVSHQWAGANFGTIHIPRIGQEVIVDFIDGDPDYPIITGRVYNADEMPPWKLPDHKTQSGILTRSTPKGSVTNANLIRFEDMKGAEELHVHAQKDLVTMVEHDEIRKVGNNRDIEIGNNHTEKIGANMQLLVGSSQDVHVGGNKQETIDGAHHFDIGGDRKEQVGGSQSLTVSRDQQEKIGMKHAVEAGMEIHLKAGMKVVIEAGLQLSLKGPGGFVDIGPAGVTIQGTMVLINSGGAAGTGGGSSPDKPSKAKKANPAKPTAERP